MKLFSVRKTTADILIARSLRDQVDPAIKVIGYSQSPCVIYKEKVILSEDPWSEVIISTQNEIQDKQHMI